MSATQLGKQGNPDLDPMHMSHDTKQPGGLNPNMPMPTIPPTSISGVKTARKTTPAKKRRSSKSKAAQQQQAAKVPGQASAVPPTNTNVVMSPMKQMYHVHQQQQHMMTTPQGNFIPPEYNIHQQAKMSPAVTDPGSMKMMQMGNTTMGNPQMGFSGNFNTMDMSTQQLPQRQFTHQQMIAMNQHQLQMQQQQQQHLQRGTPVSMTQFMTPQQNIMGQQTITQQQMHNQQQIGLNQRQVQPGNMFIHQQMKTGGGMISPRQQPPAMATTPQQQFIGQQQPGMTKPTHQMLLQQRMLNSNKIQQQISPHHMQNHPSGATPQPTVSMATGMEAISPTALQQGLLFAQQNQRQQQQPLIHPSLQTPREVPGSPGTGGSKKRSKPRKPKEGGETKSRSRSKGSKKKTPAQQTLPQTPQKENAPNTPFTTGMQPQDGYTSPMMHPPPPAVMPTTFPIVQQHHPVDNEIPMRHSALQNMLNTEPNMQQQQQQAVKKLAPTQIAATRIEPPATLPPLRGPFEDPLYAVPESYAGKYHGHDPSENVPNDLCLLGCVFVIAEYEEVLPSSDILVQWKTIIKKYGGIVETEYNSATCTHLMCVSQTMPLFRQALLDGKRCITVYWLNDILLVRKLRPPWLTLHIPTIFSTKDAPLSDHVITYTGFHQKEREVLKRMLSVAGAKFTDNLSKSNTALICKYTISLKYDKAKEWKVPSVNMDWLRKVLEGENPDLNDEQFRNFPDNATKLFTLNDENAKQILDPWKVPVRVTLDCMQRAHVKRKSSTSSESLSPMSAVKRPRLEESYQPLPRVCFTALPLKQVNDLKKKLESLGGQVCDNIKFATHLVTNRVCRTVKFLSAVSVCQFIVTPEWIEDSSRSNWLLDEEKYFLIDKAVEEKFKFSLRESLIRAHNKQLFQGYLFFITDTVLPHKKILTPIIRSAGGKVLESIPIIPDLKRIQRRLTTNNKIIIIASPKDEDLIIKWKIEGIMCHNAELVLSGILKQSIDEKSFLF